MARKPQSKHDAAILERVEMCGQCQMSIPETAILCGVAAAEIESGPLLKPYIKGKLEAELAVRRALVQKAQDGDTSAQKEFLKLAESSRVQVE